MISTIAGVALDDGHGITNDGDGGAAREARLAFPQDVAIGPDGLTYITASFDLRRILPDGTIETYVDGDEGDDRATLRTNIRLQVLGVETSAGRLVLHSTRGVVYFDDSDQLVVLQEKSALPLNYRISARPENAEILAVDASIGQVSLLTEDGPVAIAGAGERTTNGDGGSATAAHIDSPVQLKEGADGSIYVRDATLQRIRRIQDGMISTAYSFPGVGISLIDDFGVDDAGNLYVSQVSRVAKITTDGQTEVFAGRGFAECRPFQCETGAPATSLQIRRTWGVDVDSEGERGRSGRNAKLDRSPFLDQWFVGSASPTVHFGQDARRHVPRRQRSRSLGRS